MPTLLNSDLFRGISPRQSKHILNHFSSITLKKDRPLFQFNARAQYLYIVVSGEFRVESGSNKKTRQVLDYARRGDILGETALLTNQKHSGRVIAIIDSEVLRISKPKFDKLLLKYPQMAVNLGHIEAKRLRKQIVGQVEAIPEHRFIAHFTTFDGVESHYIGLNLASSMAIALNKKVAYLHLSHCEQTPIKTLNVKISENHLAKAIEKFKNYQKFNVKQWVVNHPSNISVLPSLPDILPIKIIKPTDVPRLLSILSLEFPLVFIELGSESLAGPKLNAVLKQADQVIAGISPMKQCSGAIKNYLKEWQKKIPNIEEKTHIYLNQIDILDSKQIQKEHRRQRLLFSQIEKDLKHPVDFTLSGFIATKNTYIEKNLLVNKRVVNKAVVSMRSLGRWLVKRRMGIAFGGGGARALAQIGALRVLEEQNIYFDSITGTSMGALVGALYAMDLDSHQIEERFAKFLPNDKVFTDYSLPFISFFRGRKMNKLLKGVFGTTRFEDLSVPFTCVAVDLLSGEEVHINKGLIWRAVRASMSLPVIFPPLKYKDYYLIDGGALNNVPGDILKKDRVHRVIGLNATPLEDDSIVRYIEQTQLFKLLRAERSVLKSIRKFFTRIGLLIRRPPILQLAMRVMMLEGAELVRQKTHVFDHLINLPVQEIGLFDFHRRREIIELGMKHTKKELKILKSLLTHSKK